MIPTQEIYHPQLEDILFLASNAPSPMLVVDDGFNFGLSFFETFYIKNHIVFLDEHLARLNTSLLQFNIPLHIDQQLLLDLVAHYNLKETALKLQVSAKNIIASTRPITYTSNYYAQGASLLLSPIVRSSQSELVRHKSGNYGDCILSLRNAHARGFDDCLFLNEKMHITESCIANIFIIKNKQLYTPCLDDGLLPGVVRNYILSKYNVIQTSLDQEFLFHSDGAFLTNSLVGVVRIRSIESVELINNPLIEIIRQTYLHDIKESYVS
jgi:4-amino-4-deoxychorismate lyase